MGIVRVTEKKILKGYLLDVATSNSLDSCGMMRLSSRSLFLEMYGSSSSSNWNQIKSDYSIKS